MSTTTPHDQVPAEPVTLLAGVKVLAFTHWLQGPAACQYLSDLGADVVKIEPLTGSAERAVMGPGPGPDQASALFVAGNRNARSLAVDLKSDQGRELVLSLLESHDVVVENYRPGVLNKLGLGYEEMSTRHPGVIFASATGYGPRGPLASLPGQDLLAQSLSGLAAASGARPTPAGAAIIDQHGATLLALSVVSAVVQRTRTGTGTKIEASLLNAALDLQMEALAFYLNADTTWDEAGPRDENLGTWYHQSPYGMYATADGWLTISMTDLPTLSKAFDAVGDLSGLDPMADRDEVAGRLADVLSRLTSDEAARTMDDAGVWNAPVHDYDEMIASEQVAINGILGSVGDGDWSAEVVRHPVMYDGALPAARSAPPYRGQHTREVLRESGLADERIDELVAAAVVAERENDD